jgi:hypothetical protein
MQILNANNMEKKLIPNLTWYSSVSKKKKMLPRCPFAAPMRCPRFYASQSLLSETGSVPLNKKEDEKILRFWEKSELWITNRESEPAVAHAGEKLHSINNFCPEVTFLRYGYFCTYIGSYSGEADHDFAHKKLDKESAPSDDPRRFWASCESQHYSECPYFSILSSKDNNLGKKAEKPWWRRRPAKFIISTVLAIILAFITKCIGN